MLLSCCCMPKWEPRQLPIRSVLGWFLCSVSHHAFEVLDYYLIFINNLTGSRSAVLYKAGVSVKAVAASDKHPQPRATAAHWIPLWLISRHAIPHHPLSKYLFTKGTHFFATFTADVPTLWWKGNSKTDPLMILTCFVTGSKQRQM